MKKKVMVMLTVVLAAMLALTTVALAAGRGKAQGHGMGMGIGTGMQTGQKELAGMERFLNDPEFIEKVGLTDDQIEKLTSIRTETSKAQIRNKAELQIIRIDLQDLLQQDNPDLKKIDAKLDEIGRLEVQLKKDMIHSFIEAKSVLTDEQIEKIQEYTRDQIKERVEKRRDRQSVPGEGQRRMRDNRGAGPQGFMRPGGQGGPGGHGGWGRPYDPELDFEFDTPEPETE